MYVINTDLTPLPVPPPTDNAGEGWDSVRFVNMLLTGAQNTPSAAATPILGVSDSRNILWGERAGCMLGTAQIRLSHCAESNVEMIQLACGLYLLLCTMLDKSRKFLSCLSALPRNVVGQQRPYSWSRRGENVTTWISTVKNINKLRTGDADLRFYITTVQDG